MLNRTIVAILVSLFSVSVIQAQTTFGWNFGTTTGTASATSGSNPLLTVSPITRVNSGFTGTAISNATTTGGNATPLSTGYTGASGQFYLGLGATESTLDINTTSYLSVTVTPASGYSVRLTDFDFGARASTLGATNYAIRTSVAGFGTAITGGSGTIPDDGTWNRYNTSIATVNGALNTPVEIRLYLWDNSVGTSNTLDTQIDDVAMQSTPVPEPVSIFGLSALSMFGLGVIRKRLRK